jgi:cell division inhibitor SepF
MSWFNLKLTRTNNDEDYDDIVGGGSYNGFEEMDDIYGNERSAFEEPQATPVGAAALKIVNPRGFDEAETIADFLLNGNTVLLNIEGLDRANAMRLFDYLKGATHMVGGVMTKVGRTTMVVAPKNVDVSSIEAMVSSN